jgi:hypothetical protein
MSHSPNPHTNLLNVFIQIANNKGRYYKKIVYEHCVEAPDTEIPVLQVDIPQGKKCHPD